MSVPTSFFDRVLIGGISVAALVVACHLSILLAAVLAIFLPWRAIGDLAIAFVGGTLIVTAIIALA